MTLFMPKMSQEGAGEEKALALDGDEKVQGLKEAKGLLLLESGLLFKLAKAFGIKLGPD